MIEELYWKRKEEVIMYCFLQNVNTNDLNENPPQPKKKKFVEYFYKY